MNETKRFAVKTPLGYIMVEAKGTEDEYPGVYISLSKDGNKLNADDIIACVEYDTLTKEIKTETYEHGVEEPVNITPWGLP